jgi:UDP-glucose-4-epimerase GalE
MSKTVLVTGGAGYIGSQTCKFLYQSGFQPVTYDNLVYGHRWAVQWGPLIEGDLSNKNLLLQTIKEHNIESVIHFAAYAYVGESVLNPVKYFNNNIVNTLNLLDALRLAEIKQLVFSSTCATYGTPDKNPIDESHPQKPVNPYGESKLFIEKALHWHDVAYDLKSVALRYFNAAGADPDNEIGEDHMPETHLIPLILQTLTGQRSHVEIFGTDYPTPDGTAIRDYIHVLDLANAHVRALEYLQNRGKSTALNLGTGKGYSVREVISAVEKITGEKVPFRESDRRAGDPSVLVADARKAHEVLGWKAEHSALDYIVSTAWSWAKKIKHNS